MSVDGCVAPLSVLNTACGWRPAWQALPDESLFAFANITLLLAALVAVLATPLAAVVAAVLRRRARPEPAEGGRPSGRRAVARWSAVSLPTALALALAVGEPLTLAKYQTALPNYATQQRNLQLLLGDRHPHCHRRPGPCRCTPGTDTAGDTFWTAPSGPPTN